jgi:hypothetical protein
MTTEEALTKLAQSVKTSVEDQIIKQKFGGTGFLLRSVNTTVNGNEIILDTAYYGKFVNDGHYTRALQSPQFIAARPFIGPGIEQAITLNLPIFIDNIVLDIQHNINP